MQPQPVADLKPIANEVLQPARRAGSLTLRQAVERYIEHFSANPQLSPDSISGMLSVASALQRSPGADNPIHSFGFEELTALVNHWLSCPKSLRGKKNISIRRARNIIAFARQCFDYLDASGQWDAPRRFEQIFRLRNLKEKPKVETFPVNDLKYLYQYANELARCFILLGLNCGFANMELATLKKSEINLKKGIIKRTRQKAVSFISR